MPFRRTHHFEPCGLGPFCGKQSGQKNWCCEDAKDQDDIIKCITMYKIVIQSHIPPN